MKAPGYFLSVSRALSGYRTAGALRCFVAAIALLAFVAGAVPAWSADPAALRAGEFSPPRQAPDFVLRGSDGSDLTLARYRGKVVVLLFGFTSCPVVCPTTLATLASAHKQLGDQAAGVQVVYVTVDPEKDTVAQLHDYLAKFNPTFIGGTGTEAELEAMRREYGVVASRQAAGETYTYGHSSSAHLIDRDGKLRALMPYGSAAEDYVHDLKLMLAAPPAPAAGS